MKAEWKPIETAPEDGTWVLVYVDHYHDYGVARYNAGWYDRHDYEYEASHWMPLPTPPKPEEVDEN